MVDNPESLRLAATSYLGEFKKNYDLLGALRTKDARIAELEAALRPFAFREEIELTPENDAYPVKAIVVFKDEREAALKLLKGTKE
jgi:hypothetical protein